MKYLHKWLHFINERFNPLSYAVMIFAFLGAHYALYLNFIKQNIILDFSDILHLIPLILATTSFFFKLRLFDEVKDIESDAVHHPERPLPRGILTKDDVLRITFIAVVIETVLFSYYGFWAFASAMISVIYSLVMYKEFFIKNWLRAHLTTYAVTHTFVVVFLSLTIFVALFGELSAKIPGDLIYFFFASWFLFNIFEFGRKTFARSEEKEGVDSYSKIFGKLGAVLMVFMMAVLSIVFISKTTSPFVSNVLFSLLIPVGIAGLMYAMLNNLHFAKIYRTMTSLYIILTYGIVAFLVLFKMF